MLAISFIVYLLKFFTKTINHYFITYLDFVYLIEIDLLLLDLIIEKIFIRKEIYSVLKKRYIG